ncbi:MAG: disulfide bond formation protein B [Acidimicrobiia bacterium]|nr:disulfide bond formation protein B [Acidimicrobiia bacterium]
MTSVVITFLAILSLAALALAVGATVLTARPGGHRAAVSIASSTAALSWLIAMVSTLGSLFMSEIAGFVPCALCWVQRGFMYPLVVVLAVPAIRRRPPAALIWWTLAGAAVSAYHYGVEHLPVLEDSGFCTPTAPCTTIWVNEFGFVTIPFMALCGFLAIAALTRLHRHALTLGLSS